MKPQKGDRPSPEPDHVGFKLVSKETTDARKRSHDQANEHKRSHDPTDQRKLPRDPTDQRKLSQGQADQCKLSRPDRPAQFFTRPHQLLCKQACTWSRHVSIFVRSAQTA